MYLKRYCSRFLLQHVTEGYWQVYFTIGQVCMELNLRSGLGILRIRLVLGLGLGSGLGLRLGLG